MIITDAYNSSAPNDVYGNSKDDISDMGNILVLNLAAQSIQATYK